MPDSSLKKELLELTKALIRIPSTHSRPDAIRDCADFIGSWLDREGVDYQQLVCEDVPSILALPRAGTAPVLLLCHFDVVEAESPDLFRPWEMEGRLFGRGAIDDKYGVALALILYRETMRRFQSAGWSLEDLPFGLLLTGDEEIGGFNGAARLADDLKVDFFIAIDGGSPEKIVVREKGVMVLELEAAGQMAHAARPWLGLNAFDVLIEDYRRIQELFKEESDDHWHATAVLSNCRVGNGSSNVVPERANATLDIRFTEKDDPDQLIDSIRRRVSSTVTVRTKEPVFFSGESRYLDLLLKHAGGAVAGFEHGASDARFLSQRNIPGAVWGAEGEMSQHTPDEHVVIDSLFRIYDSLESYFSALADDGREPYGRAEATS